EVGDARADVLLDHVVDRRPRAEREHLLRDGLGDRKEAGAVAGGEDDAFHRVRLLFLGRRERVRAALPAAAGARAGLLFRAACPPGAGVPKSALPAGPGPGSAPGPGRSPRDTGPARPRWRHRRAPGGPG